LPYAPPLGYCGADRSHPKEVFYQTTKQTSDGVLRFRLYDAQADEIHVVVWNSGRASQEWTASLPAGPANAWGSVTSVTIPASAFSAKGRNVIGFVCTGSYPDWRTWGVRDVTLTSP
jgi:hypothetical protein